MSKPKATCTNLDCPERAGGQCTHQATPTWEEAITAILNSYRFDGQSIDEDLVLQQDEARVEKAHQDNLAEAKAAISARVLNDVIGTDDTDTRGPTQNPNNPKHWTRRTANRNELRAAQRRVVRGE